MRVSESQGRPGPLVSLGPQDLMKVLQSCCQPVCTVDKNTIYDNAGDI